MWWEHFKTMQPTGHEITWTEFKKAFKDHHIPKGLMVGKMKELLALKQGDDTVYQYAQKFNNLCQYGEHHVDTDAKNMERFRDGLKSELYERLNLLEPNSYHELVNKAISQEDAMMKVQKEKKRPNDFASGDGSGKKFRFIKKNAHGSSQSSASGHWRMTPSSHKPSGNFQYRQAQPQVSKPKELQPRICYNCRQPGHYANECPDLRTIKIEQQTQNPGVAKGNRDKKPMIQVKQGQLNFTGNSSTREHSFLPWTFDDGTLLHPRILIAFQELNSGILVNKCSKHLFTSLPFLHGNPLIIPFSTWSFRLIPKPS
jgi:hypothetical protein